MMEIGFGGIIDKFEHYFGRLLTKGLLALIAMAIVAVCIAVIWQWIISPVLVFFNSPDRIRILILMLFYGLGVGFGIVVASLQYSLFAARRRSRESEDVFERSRQAVARMGEAAEELQRTIRENETRLLVLDRHSTPNHLRSLARKLEEEAAAKEREANTDARPAAEES